ncbi:MAG: LysE family transporter [Actinomycetota bacterium]|nr:LysE family transporter [Actinomycetota bacterium]
MNVLGDQAAQAFVLGAALGAAPGPVQLMIVNETARHGIGQGFRVMIGANGTLFIVLATLALGFSTADPSPGIVRGLRIVGGLFLVSLAIRELRSLRRASTNPTSETPVGGRLGATARGAALVILNPGAWIFFATTAAAVMARANAEGGRETALFTAVAMTLGVSLTDLGSALVGTGSRALLGERALTWVRTGLSVVLLGIGAGFTIQGLLRAS